MGFAGDLDGLESYMKPEKGGIWDSIVESTSHWFDSSQQLKMTPPIALTQPGDVRVGTSTWTGDQAIAAIKTELGSGADVAQLVSKLAGLAHNEGTATAAYNRLTAYTRQVVASVMAARGSELITAAQAAMRRDPALKRWSDEQARKAGAHPSLDLALAADRPEALTDMLLDGLKKYGIYAGIGVSALILILVLKK